MQSKNLTTALFLRIAALLCLLLFLLSCGKRDDRNDVRGQRGEPDEIQTIGSDPFWRELWFYNDAGIGYDFRRTSGCGSLQDVYLYATFVFPPVVDSTSTVIPRPLQPSDTYRSGSSPLSPD
jgi:hypothetical protein